MGVERLYDELYAIAKHVGSLDETAVSGADWILSQSRYATAPNPSGLLVEDLKRVIADIPTDTHPEKKEPDPAWNGRYFQLYAKRYFLLEAAGEQIEHRRSFGRKGRPSAVWMNRGVVYRVAAGLLMLWSDFENASGAGLLGDQGYEIEEVRMARQINPVMVREHLKYEIAVLRPDPQVLMLPFPAGKLTSVSYFTDAEILHPPPQRVTVRMHQKPWTAVVFGMHDPGAHLRIIADRISRRSGSPEAFFPVDQPIGNLGLRVEDNVGPSNEYRWEARSVDALGHVTVLERDAGNEWFIENPSAKMGYELRGFPPRLEDGADEKGRPGEAE
jgi:hypothetical protein